VVAWYLGISRGANFRFDASGMQGLLPPLDAPHHVRKHEWSEFREGANLSCHVFALDFGHTMK
jgi:hypothetical protein